jgi:TatD DNase family protein
MIQDSHAHLDMMEETEIQKMLNQANEIRLNTIISCSTSFNSNQKNLDLAQKYNLIKPAIGLYPLNVIELNEEELNRAFIFFEDKIKESIAIGEVGLDFKFSIKEEEQEKQKQVLTKFIQLSKKYNKPIIIHSRFAQRQVIELLEQNKAKKVQLHSYTDSLKLMQKAVSLGYYISCGMNLLYNTEVQKNITSFPLENLLVETDSPMIFNNIKTTPLNTKLVLEKISELKKITQKEVEEQLDKNFHALYD